MELIKIYCWCMLFLVRCFARDSIATKFVKSFVLNENKPTIVIFNQLCWSKAQQVRLTNYLMQAGVRSSISLALQQNVYLYHHQLFLVDLNCPGIEELLMNATNKNLFRSPFRWLILTNSSYEYKENLSTIGEQSILPDSDVVLAERKEDTYKMTELYKTSLNATLTVTPRGYYNDTFTDIRIHRTVFRRRDVMGHPLTMANVIQDSNTTQYHLPLEDRLEPQYDSVAKICWMNVRLAFEMLNATPRYVFSHRWGYKQNGQWSGMINDLHTSRADLGTNCLVSDTERLDVVMYTDMVAPFRVRFVFRQPPLSYVSNIFALPFSTCVWVAITVCTTIATATLYFESKWEATLERSSTQLYGIGDTLLLTMSAVSQQGCVLEPRKTPGRIIIWVLFTALMALYAAYSANIVVLLQAPSGSVRSLKHLADSMITLAANDVDYNHFVFKLYKEPVRVAIYKRIDPEKGRGQFYDINEGVERIRKGLFAFHSIVEPVYRRIEETFLEMEKCDLEEVDFLNGFDPFIPVKKDSPYLDLLRVTFKRIRESGIQSALVRRLQVPKPRCSNKAASFSSVGVLDLRAVLLFMLYGIALSLLILLAEIFHHKLCVGY